MHFLFSNFTEPTVYNIASNNIKTIPLGAMVEMGIALSKEEPLSNILWIPRASMIRNRTWYFWNVIFFHLIPAVLVDGLFKLRGRKPM
jgi:fatty acyl-CoA reductase